MCGLNSSTLSEGIFTSWIALLAAAKTASGLSINSSA